MITIALVLKSGGPYTPDYVIRLVNSIKKNASVPYQIVCLTDMEIDEPSVHSIPLKHNWPGWWSKIELFRPDIALSKTVYMDLDTLVVGNIDELLDLAAKDEFYVLRGFNQRQGLPPQSLNFATGVMVGGFSSLPDVYHTFAADSLRHIAVERTNWRCGDQGFISDITGVNIPSIQSQLPENYIVGRKITSDGNIIPKEARVICWSGEPRLHELPSSYRITDFWRMIGEREK